VITGSTAEADGRVIRHATSVPRSTTTARPPAVTLVAGQQAGQRWWTLRTAIQLCSTGCWGCDQRRQPGTTTITLLPAPPICRCTSLTSNPISRSPRGRIVSSRRGRRCIKIQLASAFWHSRPRQDVGACDLDHGFRSHRRNASRCGPTRRLRSRRPLVVGRGKGALHRAGTG
jgi:hypothetical protein